MADVNALKKKRVENPEPPIPGTPSGNLDQQPRGREATVALQLKIPPSVFERFAEQAGKEFGFKKGAKAALFLKIFEEYERSRK
jgi:hypothetical protein